MVPYSADRSDSTLSFVNADEDLRRDGELGLASPHLTDEQLIDHMLAHPLLINRPSETVLEILPLPQRAR